ncbi:hypothetical protein LPJ81_001593 [Coemansia sp. IMI 209127]|nr:hypothetical protein LPJ81_001593 [Coemansia sp. IMI 209127]
MAESQRTKHGVARSASCMSSRKVIPPMLVPSLSTLPQMQCQPSPELPEENHQRHRDSRGSETTAVLVEIESTGNHLCDLEQPSLSPPKQSKTSSPSQKTLSEACTSSEEFISNAFAASMLTEYPQLDMAFDKELDVFHTFSNSRRPYSEGFPEKSPSVETSKPSALSGNRNISRIVVPVINSQWAMYARSSYAESGLVKSTFDLAKMLPSAPQ